MSVGTGAFKVVRKLGLTPDDTKKKPTAFEDAWADELKIRREAGF